LVPLIEDTEPAVRLHAAVAIAAVPRMHGSQASSIAPPRVAAVAPQRVEEVDTEFAGIVYLVNLALHLELYGDFTQPARPGLDLPLGAFPALVGERPSSTFASLLVVHIAAGLTAVVAGATAMLSPKRRCRHPTNRRGDEPTGSAAESTAGRDGSFWHRWRRRRVRRSGTVALRASRRRA